MPLDTPIRAVEAFRVYRLEDGKYEIKRDTQTGLIKEVRRNGEIWIAATEFMQHVKVIHAMLNEIDRLQGCEMNTAQKEQYRKRAEFQLRQWVDGHSVHNKIDDECTPDFSCCIPSQQAMRDDRLIHANDWLRQRGLQLITDAAKLK